MQFLVLATYWLFVTGQPLVDIKSKCSYATPPSERELSRVHSAARTKCVIVGSGVEFDRRNRRRRQRKEGVTRSSLGAVNLYQS